MICSINEQKDNEAWSQRIFNFSYQISQSSVQPFVWISCACFLAVSHEGSHLLDSRLKPVTKTSVTFVFANQAFLLTVPLNTHSLSKLRLLLCIRVTVISG